MQRAAYAENLTLFADAIESYSFTNLAEGIKMQTRLKIFNDLLRRRLGYWIWWKMEGTKFKYFWTKDEQKKFARNLGSMERIDALIEEQVIEALAETEKEGKKREKKKSD